MYTCTKPLGNIANIFGEMLENVELWAVQKCAKLVYLDTCCTKNTSGGWNLPGFNSNVHPHLLCGDIWKRLQACVRKVNKETGSFRVGHRRYSEFDAELRWLEQAREVRFCVRGQLTSRERASVLSSLILSIIINIVSFRFQLEDRIA